MIELVDTHAHLDHPQFDADREAVIQRAASVGVRTIITVGADWVSSRQSVALAEDHVGLYAAVGVHPHEATSVGPNDLDTLRQLAIHPQVVAVGEIGLDYYREHSPPAAQRAIFEAQLEMAAQLGKPVIVHLRDKSGSWAAYEEGLDILSRWAGRLPAGRAGVLHCFSGDLKTAQAAIELGFYLGVDGPITYPQAGDMRALIAQIGMERLLLETDCPYLSPQFRRGRRNEPAYLLQIAAGVAGVLGSTVEQVASITTRNAKTLFTWADNR